MPVNLKNQKEEKRAALIRALGVPKSTRAIVLSYIQDDQIQTFMSRACAAIGVQLLTEIDDLAREGADAFIADVLDAQVPIHSFIQSAIVPIIPAENPYKKSFSEFNPMKFEGNAFLFDEKNEFQMFEKLVRYLENVRYAGDKRTLLKNVSETKI